MNELKFETQELAPDRLYLKASGSVNRDTLESLANWTRATQDKISEMHLACGKPISCVFDITEVEETKDPEVIAKLVEFQKINKPHVFRTALIVLKPEIRLNMTIISELAERDNIHPFTDLEEGKAWAFGEK
jgi:hypothetical protein